MQEELDCINLINLIEKIIKGLKKIPFLYNNDNKIVDKYFKETIKIFDKNDLKGYIKEYEKYYNATWIKYLNNNILNYHNIEKFRRSNS